MQEHIKVPQDRIGAIIGVEGKIKETGEKDGRHAERGQRERHCRRRIRGGRRQGDEGQRSDQGRSAGFQPGESAEALDDEDLSLDVIDLSKIATRRPT